MLDTRNFYQQKQQNTANKPDNLKISEAITSPESRHNIITIAELRSRYIARQQQNRERYKKLHEQKIKARYLHASIIRKMLDRIAICYNLKNHVTMLQVYALFESTGWICPATGTMHRANSPLNIEFIKALDTQHGAITIENIRPRYYEGLYAGEFVLNRYTIEFKPPALMPVLAGVA